MRMVTLGAFVGSSVLYKHAPCLHVLYGLTVIKIQLRSTYAQKCFRSLLSSNLSTSSTIARKLRSCRHSSISLRWLYRAWQRWKPRPFMFTCGITCLIAFSKSDMISLPADSLYLHLSPASEFLQIPQHNPFSGRLWDIRMKASGT
jgi:hypothetical protein